MAFLVIFRLLDAMPLLICCYHALPIRRHFGAACYRFSLITPISPIFATLDGCRWFTRNMPLSSAFDFRQARDLHCRLLLATLATRIRYDIIQREAQVTRVNIRRRLLSAGKSAEAQRWRRRRGSVQSITMRVVQRFTAAERVRGATRR